VKFTLPFTDAATSGKNSLLFYYLHPFDTNWLVHIVKKENKIRGVYYTVLPTMHRDVNSYPDSLGTLFFEGASFPINESIWDSLTLTAQMVLESDSDLGKRGCTDCSTFCLEFDGKTRFVNDKNEAQFSSFSNLLRRKILLHAIELKREMVEMVDSPVKKVR